MGTKAFIGKVASTVALAAVVIFTAGARIEPAVPETPADWGLAEMAVARANLEAMIADGARERHPVLVAEAERRFECWMIDQEQSPPTDSYVDCRAGFLQVVDTLAVLEGDTALARR